MAQTVGRNVLFWLLNECTCVYPSGRDPVLAGYIAKEAAI